MADDQYLNAVKYGMRQPACETGRHIPPHPDVTCEQIDAFIAARDQILRELLRDWIDSFDRGLREMPLVGTVFAQPAEPAAPVPDKPDVDRALDILRPHLAWDTRYREGS